MGVPLWIGVGAGVSTGGMDVVGVGVVPGVLVIGGAGVAGGVAGLIG